MDRAPFLVASATGVDVALPIAATGSRSYAFLIDWHIRIIVALAWFVVAAAIAAGSPTKLSEASAAGTLLSTLPAAALYLLYHPVLEVLMRGRTPGKRMAGVRIVTRDGGTPSTGSLLVRNVFRLVDGLPMFYLVGLIATLVSRESVRVGDMAAGTLLVHDGDSSVEALDVLAGVARDTPHEPELIDLAQDVLRRWDSLEPQRRSTLARALLTRLGAADEGGTDSDLRARLQSTLNQASVA